MPRFVLAVTLASGCMAHVEAVDLVDDEPTVEAASPVAVIPPAAVAREVELPTPSQVCIADLEQHAIRRWPDAFGETLPDDDMSTTVVEADLDGDGAPDHMVTHEWSCGVTGNCPWVLYLSHEGCPRVGGTFWAAYLDIGPGRHDGVLDLAAWTKNGCVGMAGGFEKLQFRDGRYAFAGTIDCACPYDDAGEPTHAPQPPECPSLES